MDVNSELQKAQEHLQAAIRQVDGDGPAADSVLAAAVCIARVRAQLAELVGAAVPGKEAIAP
jgi:hypothetical protein